MKVSSLHIYPIKGVRAVDVSTAVVARRGLHGDRRWMLVDDDDRFLTQREEPRLATLVVTETDEGLHIEADDLTLDCPRPTGDARRTVTVWRSTVDAASSDPAVDAALSEWFGRSVHLVHQDDRAHRAASVDWAENDAPVSFADGYPLLIVTESALEDLNRRMAVNGSDAVPMRRFRPNVVLEGVAAWEDDGWASVRIGAVTFDLVKPCTRCIVTTTDQTTGARSSDEPLRTLAQFRRSTDPRARGVVFGWNAVPRTGGSIAVGDALEVLERRTRWPIG